MGTLRESWEQLKSLDIERRLGLRPDYPKTAIEVDGNDLTLVQTKAKRGSSPVLELFRTAELPQAAPSTINDVELASVETLAAAFSDLFVKSGTRPGKLSLVLPDNVAKISLLDLPERPPSKRQLEELVRFKTRRGAPFRLSEAAMSYQVFPGTGRGIQVLVAMVRRGLIERYEAALESIGARPGLIDLCTPNLINLFRRRLDDLSKEGDVALLNCAGSYFSMAIVRRGKLVFFRCKTYSMAGSALASAELVRREMIYSRSYYDEKLGGDGIRHLLVRRGMCNADVLGESLSPLGAESTEWVDPTTLVSSEQPGQWTGEVAQRIAPALGAALGRA